MYYKTKFISFSSFLYFNNDDRFDLKNLTFVENPFFRKFTSVSGIIFFQNTQKITTLKQIKKYVCFLG